MMPPVSLAWNADVHWACAGAHASIPHIATRLAVPIIRIADSSEMESAMRIMGTASLVAICGMLACAPAQAQWTSAFQANDTGGIIAYPLAAQTDARQLAVDHCASYG